MKRFSAREFALLCVPVAVVAGAGFWASRLAAPDDGKPKLRFSVTQPTALQAFSGVKAVADIELIDSARGIEFEATSSGVPQRFVWLQSRSSQGIKNWDSNKGGKWTDINIADYYDKRFSLNMKQIPPGEIIVGFDGYFVPVSDPQSLKLYRFQNQWKLEKARIKPFDFALPRQPLIEIKSVKLINKPTLQQIGVEIAWLLMGHDMNEQTTVEQRVNFDGGSSITRDPASPRRGTIRCDCISSFGEPLDEVTITGRISADNRWPLAFAVEPFDYKTAKVGQKLKFKSWPAPLPPGAKN